MAPVLLKKKKKMDRKRLPKRRGLTSTEIRAESTDNDTMHNPILSERLHATPHTTQTTTTYETVEILNCVGRNICGNEAACQIEGPKSICICPHDLSLPTPDLRCPNRNTVQGPKPIHNIIPPSSNVTNSTTALPEAEQIERIEPRVPEVIGIVIGCFVLLAMLSGLIYCCKRRSANAKSKRSSLEGSPMNLKNSLLLANKYTPNPQYFACTSPEVTILTRDSLVFLQDIGEGCFGKVYKGELTREEGVEVVAVKVLKDSASGEAEEDFMREVDIMSTFRHSNILSLVGVVLRDTTHGPWMVFEYMPYGDLAEVLRANSQTLRAPTPGLQPLNMDSLHWITMQIASGMTYLAAQRFVHRDLACRNCLVGTGLVVKIADFGMSRDVYTCDYYKVGGSRMLPVRWMSPESVTYGRFTLESDVWSFGVVLWEVYSLGKQPYYGHNNEEVLKLIVQGIMLIPPEGCPPYICQIMRDCWKTEPRDRIRFMDILDRLEKSQDKPSQIGSLPRPPQGPVTIRTPDALDPAGYLLPAPTTIREYLQLLPTVED